jgi:hypothetical protein
LNERRYNINTERNMTAVAVFAAVLGLLSTVVNSHVAPVGVSVNHANVFVLLPSLYC